MENYTVYKHTFPNGKVYIGITKRTPEQRWGCQGYGYRSNLEMWQAINTYGWDNIQHEVLFRNKTMEEASQLEKILIKQYNALNPNFGYNKTAGGTSNCRRYDEDEILNLWNKGANLLEIKNEIKCCEQTLRSILKINGVPSEEITARERGVSVKQYDLQGNYIKTFPSLAMAMRSLNKTNCSHILQCCNKERPSYCNYIWRYANNTEKIEPIQSSIHTRKVNQYNLSGEFLKTFDTVKSAAQAVGINSNNISRACRGGRHSAGGYKWKYAEKQKKNYKGIRPVLQYNLEKELLNTFSSINEASRETKISKTCIQSACCGKQKTAGGFIWKYCE